MPEPEPEPTHDPEEPRELIDVEEEISSTWNAGEFTGPAKDSLGNQTRVGLQVWAYQKGAPVRFMPALTLLIRTLRPSNLFDNTDVGQRHSSAA